jgi:hypothetical protein
VRRWNSWYRWVTLAMLGAAVLTIAAAIQRQHDATSDLDAGLIPSTVPELLRLVHDAVLPPTPARPGPPAALVGLATPPPVPHTPSPSTLERLRRDHTMITTKYSRRN